MKQTKRMSLRKPGINNDELSTYNQWHRDQCAPVFSVRAAVRREQHGQAGRRGGGRLQRHPVHVRLHLPHVRRHRRRPLLCHGQQVQAK